MKRSSSILLALVALATLTAWMASPTSAPIATPEPHGEWVKFANAAGDSIPAYVAWPERKDQGPTVLVIHDNRGLSVDTRSVVDRLAGQGFLAIAPDLLGSKYGKTPENTDSARKYISGLEPERVMGDLDATAAFVDTLPGARRGTMAVIGFCWGGGKSFAYAAHNPRLKAAVVCYGPAPDSASLTRIRVPILGVYAENDARINDQLPRVSASLHALGQAFTYDIYPGTGHGFLSPGRMGYDTDQPAKAWQRIFSFYHEQLGG